MIYDFTKHFNFIEGVLNNLVSEDFIILTTIEGSRGVDYKGRQRAHVIFGYSPTSYAECI